MNWIEKHWDELEPAGHYPRQSLRRGFRSYQFFKSVVGKMRKDRHFIIRSHDGFYALPYAVVHPFLSVENLKKPRGYWSIGVDRNEVLVVDGKCTGVEVSRYCGDETIPLDANINQ